MKKSAKEIAKRIKLRKAAYYQKNKKRYAEIKRKWCLANPEKLKAAKKRYYIKNRKFCLQLSRNWQARHPNYMKEWRLKLKMKKARK